jgi:hypothetical protein
VTDPHPMAVAPAIAVPRAVSGAGVGVVVGMAEGVVVVAAVGVGVVGVGAVVGVVVMKTAEGANDGVTESGGALAGGRVGGLFTVITPIMMLLCGWQKYRKDPDSLNWTVKFPDNCSGDWNSTPGGRSVGLPLTTLWLAAPWFHSHVTVSPTSISTVAPDMLNPQLIR